MVFGEIILRLSPQANQRFLKVNNFKVVYNFVHPPETGIEGSMIDWGIVFK